MTRPRDRSAEVALGFALVAMLAVRAVTPTPVDALYRATRSVMPNGTSISTYPGGLRTLGVTGDRWVSRRHRVRVSAYHVLFVDPAPDLPHPGWRSEGGQFSHRVYEALEDGRAREPGFDMTYRPYMRSLDVNGRRYRLSRGNLFVVRLDQDGGARVQQLPAHLRGTGHMEVLTAFRQATRGDPELQRALSFLQPDPPNARRKCRPRAARGAASSL